MTDPSLKAEKKKRKRSSLGGDEARKRVQIADDVQLVRFQRAERPQSLPMLEFKAYTSGVRIPKNVPLFRYQEESQKSKRAPKNPSPDVMVYSSAHPTMEYTGTVDKKSQVSSSLKHYVGVFDESSGTVKFMEVSKILLRDAVKARLPAAEEYSVKTSDITVSKQRQELNLTFGSKKAKKAIESSLLNAIAPNPGENDSATAQPITEAERALVDAIGEATSNMASREMLEHAAAAARPVPRAFAEAERVEDVYKPEEFIGPIYLTIPVSDWLESVRSQENVQLASRYVASRLVRVATGQDAGNRLRLLRYLYYLIMFLKLSKHTRDARKPVPKPVYMEKTGAVEDVANHMRRHFTADGLIDKFHQDLLIAYCAAITCIIDNFETDVHDLAFDLFVDASVMSQYFRQIGAKIRQRKNPETKEVRKVAVLALPLDFPKASRFGKR